MVNWLVRRPSRMMRGRLKASAGDGRLPAVWRRGCGMCGDGHTLAGVMGVLPDRMYAYGFASNGGPEVFERRELPVPEPGAGQVLIEVAFAGVNFAEVQHRRGEFGAPDGPGGYDVSCLDVS